MAVKLKIPKTDQFSKGVWLYFLQTGVSLCPVEAMYNCEGQRKVCCSSLAVAICLCGAISWPVWEKLSSRLELTTQAMRATVSGLGLLLQSFWQGFQMQRSNGKMGKFCLPAIFAHPLSWTGFHHPHFVPIVTRLFAYPPGGCVLLLTHWLCPNHGNSFMIHSFEGCTVMALPRVLYYHHFEV